MLSIIIPTYKRLNILRETYCALQRACEEINIEVIIVNDDKNSSLNNIRESISINTDNTIIIANPGKGAAAARNAGSEIAYGELLLFLDDDIILNNNTVKNIISLHNKHEKILSTPLWEYSSEMLAMLNKSPFGRYRIACDYTSIKGISGNEFNQEANIFEVGSLATFCLSVKKHHYKILNGMDESFPYAGCEDQDFALRAKFNGFKLLLDENNVVGHNELDRAQKGSWLSRQFSGVQGFVLLCQKFPDRKQSSLWLENTPISKMDSFSLKGKKVKKALMRQNFALRSFNILVNLAESLKFPDSFLFKLYSKQAGIYINIGFQKSYNNARRPYNG